MYCVTVLFKVAPENADTFVGRVRRQASTSMEKETGCLQFDVWTDENRPEDVFLYEVYSDRAAFDAHRASRHFKAFAQKTADVIIDKTIATWDAKW